MKKKYWFGVLLNLSVLSAVGAEKSLTASKGFLLMEPPSVSLPFQQTTVSGTVRSSANTPLDGVTVMVKNTNTGTSTDSEGRFELNNIAPNAVLVFQSSGYKEREVAVSGRSVVDVTLEEDVAGLDEVVVVGYGTVRKRDLTGAVQRVNATQYRDQSNIQLTDMLAGTVAGLQSNQGTSAQGGGSLLIRGENSINASSSPMVVLDGVIYNGALRDINPNDIETIDILKDASSAAVYGARAANGVILVTTKRGKMGKPKINFMTKQGLANATSTDYGVRGPEEYLEFRRDYLRTLGGTEPPYFWHNPDDLPEGVTLEQWRNAGNNPNPDNTLEWLSRLNFFPVEIEKYLAGEPVNWINEVMPTARRQEYDVSVGGANEHTQYYWSLGFQDNEGIVRGDQFSNVRSRLNLDLKVADWMNVGVNAQYTYRNESTITANLGSMAQSSPYAEVYNEDGSAVFFPHGYTIQNPLINTLGQDRDNVIQTIFASLYSEIKLPFGFKYRLSFQPRSTFTRDYNYWSPETITGSQTYANGFARRLDASGFEWMVDNLLTWNKQFGVHGFDLTMLYNAEKFQSWTSTMENQSFLPSPNLGYGGMQFGNNPNINSNDIVYTANAWMARLNYNLMDRYLLTASLRQDGFSGFGQENPYALFPATAVAWQVHNEQFFNADFVDQLKLRVSWGVNGNREIGPYAAFAQMGSVQYYDGSNTLIGVQTTSLANSQLSWEETESLNFGVDVTLFNNRINLTADYYDKSTSRLLVQRTLPRITGFNNVTTNIGALANKGFELTASSMNINKPNFSWISTLNFSFNRNRITRLFGEEGTYTLEGQEYTGELPDFTNQWFIGHQLDAVWNYNILGVWQEEEAAQAAEYSLLPGDYKVEDVDGNMLFEAVQDRQFIGHTLPRYSFGLRNEFNFLSNFTASVFLRADVGHIRAFSPLVAGFSTYGLRSTPNFEYWTPENRSDEYPRLSRNTVAYGGGITPYKNSSFLRVQDVTLSYNLPLEFADRINLGGARIFLSARNPLTFSNWPGWDPESGLNPMPKIYTFGLDISL